MQKKKSQKPNSSTLVVVRTYGAGVHIGELVSHDGQVVVLRNARRLWRWRGANTLHEVANRGVSPEYTRLSEVVESITLTTATEIIPATEAARASLTTSRWPA